MKLLMTGGCGFIGSAVVRHLMRRTDHVVINVDKMTYSASEDALEEARGHNRHVLLRSDIADADAMRQTFATHQPDAVMHLAAESHVDRSIDGPAAFVQTNVVGTFTLLEVARHYAATLSPERRAAFRFHHVSTDEVFGSLGPQDAPFTETMPTRTKLNSQNDNGNELRHRQTDRTVKIHTAHNRTHTHLGTHTTPDPAACSPGSAGPYRAVR